MAYIYCFSYGLSDCRTIGLSDYRNVGLSDCRTIGLSDYSYDPQTTHHDRIAYILDYCLKLKNLLQNH